MDYLALLPTGTPEPTVDNLKLKLNCSPIWCELALLVVYGNQTDDEQNSQVTKYNNGKGFTGVDADFLSSLAKQIQKKLNYGVKLGTCLSNKQLGIAYRKMPKYAKQVLTTLYGNPAKKTKNVVPVHNFTAVDVNPVKDSIVCVDSDGGMWLSC